MFNIQSKIDTEKHYYKLIMLASVLIIVFKIILMGIFSSDYQNMMFMPFVETFLKGNNPYEYYYDNQLLSSFPYPPIMLLIESIGAFLLYVFNPGSVFIRNILFKLPLLLFDIVGAIYVWKICKRRVKYVLLLYFCSPIIIYSIYMHGQLDIVPTVLLLMATYYITNSKKLDYQILGPICLGLAIGTKFHILAVLPLIMLYLYKKRGFRSTFYSMVIVGIIVLCSVGVFWCDGLIANVIFNKEQTVMFDVFIDYGATKLIIPILVLVLIYLKVYEINIINKELLFCLLGILFAIFLVCVPPMPGWFVWIVPFLSIYFVFNNVNKYKVMYIYTIFNLIYVVYFAFFHITSYTDLYAFSNSLQFCKVENTSVKDAIFTLLVGCLVMIVFEMFQYGIASNALYGRRNMPFTIGIAGDSGSGKSELLDKLEKILGGKKEILYIEGDGDHRWERGDGNWEKYTHLDPKANYLYRQAEDIAILREGSTVKRVDYDHNSGTFTKKRRIEPKKYIVLCGLHSLYLPQVREVLDLKIYMDTDETLRKFWKIQRDIGKRGYSSEDINAQIEKRIPDAMKYIYPQKQFSDISIMYFDKNLKDCFVEEHQVILSLKLMISIAVNVDTVMEVLKGYGIKVKQLYNDDLLHQELIFDGNDLWIRK